ncbi:hypothetical protein KUTeg_024005 [Tegillarca granosa]|uniref:Uncharacterized protein n=1 Tax=Tegillarca granosa TaxID=220873 RepID=A0ABQ9DWP4_TEGGR|nr:hypothetical protein KUTeg_024005 [Tegillarca granosa]
MSAKLFRSPCDCPCLYIVSNYIEKTIKINQKPKNSRGFGFTIAGGADRKQPLEVTKVNLGAIYYNIQIGMISDHLLKQEEDRRAVNVFSWTLIRYDRDLES